MWRSLRHKYVLPLLGVDDKIFQHAPCMVLPWMPHGNVRNVITSWKEPGDGDPVRVHTWVRMFIFHSTRLGFVIRVVIATSDRSRTRLPPQRACGARRLARRKRSSDNWFSAIHVGISLGEYPSGCWVERSPRGFRTRRIRGGHE